MKKKVLFFITSLSLGGTEKATIAYLNKLSQFDNIEIHLCVMFKIDCIETLEANISDLVKITYLTESNIGNLFVKMQSAYAKGLSNKISYGIFKLKQNILLKKQFQKVVREYQPSTLIQADSVMPDYFTHYKNLNKIIFIHFSVDHIFSSYLKRYRINYWLNRIKSFDYIIAVSKGIYQQLSDKIDEKKLHLLYNPLFREDILLSAKQEVVLPPGFVKDKYIVSVGRLDENQKDFAGLIKAMSLLKHKYAQEYKLLIVGDGRDKENLQKLVQDLQMQDSIHFTGNKKNPYPYIVNSLLFVLSTKFEGFGIVLQEALLLDRLVLASNCFTGPAEILNHEKLLVPVGDVDSLAKKIHTLLENEELQQEIRRHLRDQKTIFDPMNSLHKIYTLV